MPRDERAGQQRQNVIRGRHAAPLVSGAYTPTQAGLPIGSLTSGLATWHQKEESNAAPTETEAPPAEEAEAQAQSETETPLARTRRSYER